MASTSTIQLPVGPIKAIIVDDSFIHARGIPYAKAQRFEKPQPTETWTEALDCTGRAPICPQLPSRLESVMGPLTKGHSLSEDCLRVSIIAPRDVTNAPVMVWLHGGAYISGGGDLDCYQPIDLAKRGIVCVNINYRLGVFGYLHLEGIAPPILDCWISELHCNGSKTTSMPSVETRLKSRWSDSLLERILSFA